MDSELFSSHKPLYIHVITTQNPSSIAGMPQGAYGYGVLITLLSKYESTWGTCQIYMFVHWAIHIKENRLGDALKQLKLKRLK